MANLTTDDRARQGPSGRPVLYVLLGALALCAVALTGFMLWTGSESPDHASQNASREAVTGSTSGSSNANPTDRISPANPAYPAPANPTATGSTNR
jgi:flagellar basal body-associated protein FliL